MKVAVCIVSFRNPHDVAACLAKLAQSAYADFEVVVCENGGPHAYETLLTLLPGHLPGGQRVSAVWTPDNPGYAAGVNRCIEASRGADAWWVLNPDALPDPDALDRMRRWMHASSCDAVGCTLVDCAGLVESRGGRWRRWLARAESIDHGKPLSGQSGRAPRVDYLSGASMLVSRKFVDTAGPMREDYFLYAEEVEWCLRARRLGLGVTVAVEAVVAHLQGTTTGSVRDIRQRPKIPVFLDERNKLLVTRDCFPACLPIAAAASLVLVFLRFARRGAWMQLGFGLQGWWAGVVNHRGKPAWIES
jgi:GT2 family glycosyltransferase